MRPRVLPHGFVPRPVARAFRLLCSAAMPGSLVTSGFLHPLRPSQRSADFARGSVLDWLYVASVGAVLIVSERISFYEGENVRL